MKSRVDLPEDEKKMLLDQAAGTTAESLHVYFQMLLRGEEEIRRSSMPKIALEMLLLRMAQLPRLESIDALLDRIAKIELSLKEGAYGGCLRSFHESVRIRKKGPLPLRLRPRIGQRTPAVKNLKQKPPSLRNPVSIPMLGFRQGRPASTALSSRPQRRSRCLPLVGFPVGPAASNPALPVSAAEAVEGWDGFVRFLESHNPILWAKVSHCSVRASGESLELEVPEMFEKSANDPEFIRSLEEASQAFFGVRLQWVIMSKLSRTREGPAVRGTTKSVKPSNAKQIAGHAAVQQAIEILGAELVEVKPFRGAELRGGKRKNE